MKTDNSVLSVHAGSSDLFKTNEPLNIRLAKINQSELLKAAKEKEKFETSPWYKKHLLQIVTVLICLATIGGGVAYATASIIVGSISIMVIFLLMLAMFRNQDRYIVISGTPFQGNAGYIGDQKRLGCHKNIR